MTKRAVATVYHGNLFRVETVQWTNDQGSALQREVVRHPGAVMVIPVLDAAHPSQVVMIQNYRLAVDERLWEFPAGKLEPGEAPELAAARELEEETGYRAERIYKLGEFYTSPGFADEMMHVFRAEQLTFVGQRLEAGEDIHTATLALDDALAMVRDGRLRDGKTIAGLMMAFGSPASSPHVAQKYEQKYGGVS